MNLTKITEAQFDEAYALMQGAFRSCEMRTKEKQRELLQNPAYVLLGGNLAVAGVKQQEKGQSAEKKNKQHEGAKQNIAQNASVPQEQGDIQCGEDAPLACVIALWKFDEFVFIEHIVTDPALRGQGLGGKVLEQLKKNYTALALETEYKTDAMSDRRLGFYLRHGFETTDCVYNQPALSGGATVRLQLLTCNCTLQAEQIKQQLFATVYAQK